MTWRLGEGRRMVTAIGDYRLLSNRSVSKDRWREQHEKFVWLLAEA
ncbi:hypothetical protein Pint_20118 [Pistacia integerrima]|uniref:Uncharacterized protein n=1 Tax=Pistacia integerrima TaxID=434235 RepID=A0ACC0XA65_9ROSI|nr:hypothetical protein Pint_20118 [Pistacia integerrima]